MYYCAAVHTAHASLSFFFSINVLKTARPILIFNKRHAVWDTCAPAERLEYYTTATMPPDSVTRGTYVLRFYFKGRTPASTFANNIIIIRFLPLKRWVLLYISSGVQNNSRARENRSNIYSLEVFLHYIYIICIVPWPVICLLILYM